VLFFKFDNGFFLFWSLMEQNRHSCSYRCIFVMVLEVVWFFMFVNGFLSVLLNEL
jgi:hypothetical protein